MTRGRLNRSAIVVASALALALVFGFAPSSTAQNPADTEYNPWTPSQMVDCQLVDQLIAMIPHGDGVRPVTEEETGPGGWRYNGDGRSFVTFDYVLNDNGTPNDSSDDSYDVNAGRSAVGINGTIINDYPMFLDLQQNPVDDILTFSGRRGSIVLTGSAAAGFTLPGAGDGQVIINVTDPDGDGAYEGCARTPIFQGFTVQGGGSFLQQEYFKAYAETDPNGVVTFYEWTEISTFKNTDPNAY